MFIELPIGYYRKDAIIGITKFDTVKEGGLFSDDEEYYWISILFIDGGENQTHFGGNEKKRDAIYKECIEILKNANIDITTSNEDEN